MQRLRKHLAKQSKSQRHKYNSTSITTSISEREAQPHPLLPFQAVQYHSLAKPSSPRIISSFV
ncbi:hypothetical protein SynMVIR181_02251 [Synechococcus sp. MVIR-18-1]|nr:hypothetical protein SynMVIR181_02251 [Synechococcus sp. MVIR-18-1]